ncbi:MAG: hypothetical protein K0U75_11705 [Actinomycetia bacterium]|nr:hypothetical protein [Actinomycetes bacterium]
MRKSLEIEVHSNYLRGLLILWMRGVLEFERHVGGPLDQLAMVIGQFLTLTRVTSPQ